MAEIYGYETKNFKRQVKNNQAKFEGDDFMFQLTKDEWESLRCKKFTSSWGGSRYLPLAFTEQGIYMLMTVLRGASSKDADGRITSILEDPDRKKYDVMIKDLLKNKQLILK